MAYDCDIGRLCTAMKRSRLALRRFREERREAVRQYVGNHWSEEGTREQIPLNLISMYITIVGRQLIAKNPRVMLSTFQMGNKPIVSAMEAWVNKQIENMGLDNTLQRVVLDGLFSIGIAKIGLATAADSAQAGWNIKAGMPFCERVDLDDFVFDIHARDIREAGFMGHRYRVPLDVIRDDKLYGKARKDLVATNDARYNAEGDERVNVMGRGPYGANVGDDFEDYVDLWEVYVPRHRKIYTMADFWYHGAGAVDDDAILREQDWIGPDTGPYPTLGYGTVPGNPMPKSPIQDLLDQHLFANAILRKNMRQALRQKSVLPVRSEEDVSRLNKTNDGEGFLCTGQDPKEVSFGGPNQMTLGMFMQSKDLFSWLAGNIDLMGGLSPQSKTATQDKMLNENSGAILAASQATTINYVAQVLKSLCWYFHHDPNTVQKSAYSVPGLPNLTALRQVGPEQRSMIPWDELDIRVDPYSMQHDTPQGKLAKLNNVVQTIVMPMMGLLQQSGKGFDIDVYLRKVGKYMDMPDMQEIITLQDPPAEPPPSGGEEPGMPPQTSRSYERISSPGRTQKGNDMNMMTTLFGGDAGGAPEGNGQPQMAGA